jgi:hypothetical protein
MSDILDLVNTCGQQNIPGVKTRAWVVCLEDVDTVPDVVGGPTLGDNLTISADIVLKANKFWAAMDIVSETGEVKNTQLGSNGSKSFQSTFDFKVPNPSIAVDQWFEERANSCFIAIVEEKNGDFKLLGNVGSPVQQAAAEGTSGMGADSERVWTVNWLSTTGRPAIKYAGVIDVDPLT